MNHVGFPKLGWFTEMNRVAFTLFGRDFYWYGIIMGAAFLAGVIYAIWRAKRIGFDTDKLVDLILIATPFAIIGARLYYVLFTLDQYDSFLDVIAIWDGGVAIYGALIAAVLVSVIYCKLRKQNLWDVLDIASPALMLGQAIGRWGNFVNVEAYGTPTDLPWKMEIYDGYGYIDVHPTFLYESLWNLIGFIWINLYFKKRKFKGEIFWMYLGWYGLGRSMVEGLRTDSLMWGDIRVSQIFGILCFVVSIIMIIVLRRHVKRIEVETAAYAPVFTEAVPLQEEHPAEENAAEEREDGESEAADAQESGETELPPEPDAEEVSEEKKEESGDGQAD